MISKRALAIFFALIMVASGIGTVAISVFSQWNPQGNQQGHASYFTPSGTTSGGNSYVDEGQGITYSFGFSINVVSAPLTVTATLSVNGYQSSQSVTFSATGDKSHTFNFGYTWSSTSGSVSGTSYGWSISTTDNYGGNVGGDSGTTYVYTDPTVSVSSNLNPSDSGQSFTLTASVSGGVSPYTYQWYSGPSGSGTAISGATSSTYSASESPTSTGSYDFYVSIKDSTGYAATSGTFIQNVNAVLVILPSSSLNPSDTGQSVEFSTAVSGGTGSYSSYSYVLYDGSSSSDSQLASGSTSQFTYNFGATGTYLLDYSVTDSNSYTVSNSLTQTVNSDPTVSISSSQNPTDVGNSVTFSSSVSGGTPGYSYSWSVNGNAYTTSDVTVSFGSSGTYVISLTVTDAAGYAVTQTMDETVNTDPTVTASSSVSSADIGYAIEFSSTPSGGSGSYGYSWTLNGNQISTSQGFSYSFSSAGSYTLTVTITDAVGVSSSATVTVTINDNPSVSVSSSQNPTDIGNSVTFASSVSGGTGTDTYSWTINGVQESTASQFSYSFSSAGTFYVNVTVTDSDGHTASYSFTETVNPDPSVVIHVVHNPTDVGIWANFSASASGGTGLFAYSWTINGQPFTTAYVNYTFTASGTFPISLTVTDANGNQATADVNEVVNPDPSVAIEGQYATVDQGINDTLFAQVTGGTSPFNYTWSLGSAILNYSQEFHLQFASTGTFQLNLSVKDSLGEVASASYTVQVIAKPSALIEGPNKTDKSTTMYWEGYGSYGTAPYNYYWYLNGVNTSSGLYFQYSFPDTGGYNISLLIVDSQGSRAYAYLDITVDQLPSVTVTESRSATDAGIPVFFNASVSGGTPFFNYTWSIGGIGFVGYQQDLVYVFSSPGYYNVSVRVSDGSGNSASASIEIRINDLPEVSIGMQYANVDPNVTDSFNSIVTGGTPGFTYAWYVNGSPSGNSGSLNYSFSGAGIYPVRLVVQDSQGISASYVMDITVVSYPQASIIPARTSLDANVSDEFRASGSGGVGPYSYEWVIAGHTFTNSTVSYSFLSPGSYTVQLVISDSFGRDASSSVIVSVYSDPTVQVSWSGKAVVSQEFQLYANVTGGIAPYGISWIFPSGQHETGSSIDHVFSSSGPDIFEVQVSDQGGFTETRNFTIDVGLYVAIAANQTSGLGPLAVQFSSSVLGGSGYSYNWSFGNSQYSLEQDPSYTFPEGNYTVHFSVTSANGATGGKNITITSLPPPVSFEYSSGLNITQAFHFTAIPNWDAKGPYNMSWSFPNGQTVTGMNISYKFPVYNEINTVIATFNYGSGKSWTQYLTVRMVPAIPSVSFSPPSIIPVDTMLSLNASASAPDSRTFSYSWDINGTSDSGQSVLFYFSHAGNYTVSITVTDGLGASSTETRIIDVLPQETNSSIVLSYTKFSAGPMTYYTIKVRSLHGITAVEAFLGTTMISPLETNESYTPQGEVAYFNLSMDQGNYNSGTYSIRVVAFNNDSASNSITMPFTVSSSLSQNPFSLGTVISFFGGLPNFLIIILTLSGIGIAAMQLRKPPIDVVATSGGKTHTYQLDTKK